MTKDDLIGDLLYTTAMTYHAELSTMNFITAKTMNINAVTVPSETIFATKLNVMMFFGIPRYVRAGGLNMDADYLMQIAKAKDGNNDTVKQYMLSSGMTSSALEHSVPEQLFSTPDAPAQAISTVKALKIANDQGIPIYTVNQSNIATVMPQLQVDQYVKDDIQNAVNAGKVVTVSKSNINFNGWNGCGYIITNPETGGGGYMISGGTSGANLFLLWASVFLLVSVIGSLGLLPLILITIAGALINMFGSQYIKISYGLQKSYEINFSTVVLNVLGIIAGIALGAGGLALSQAVKTAALPEVISYLGLLILAPTAGILDYLLFWVKNLKPLSIRRMHA